MNDWATLAGPFGAPEPPEQFFIEQGWRRGESGWLKPDGTPVFFADIINAYPPLRAWVRDRTRPRKDRA